MVEAGWITSDLTSATLASSENRLEGFGEFLSLLSVALDLECEDGSAALGEVLIVKLLLSAGSERGVVYLFYVGVILEEVYYLECVLNVALYSQRKGFQTLKQQERVERRDGSAQISHQRGADLEDVSDVARSLGEYYAVVRGVRLAESGELIVLRPVELACVYDNAAHYSAVAADELGSRMYYYVCAVLDRSEQVRSSEGAVNYQRDTVAVCDLGNGLEVDNVGIGVAEFQRR